MYNVMHDMRWRLTSTGARCTRPCHSDGSLDHVVEVVARHTGSPARSLEMG